MAKPVSRRSRFAHAWCWVDKLLLEGEVWGIVRQTHLKCPRCQRLYAIGSASRAPLKGTVKALALLPSGTQYDRRGR